MRIVRHADQAEEDWRAGVATRMLVAAENGAAQLCIFEQRCAPGLGAPTHLHAVEEVLTVISGEAEIWVGEDRSAIEAGGSVIVPAGFWHGFRNIGKDDLHVRAILAAPVFEASYEDRAEITRRYLPGGE